MQTDRQTILKIIFLGSIGPMKTLHTFVSNISYYRDKTGTVLLNKDLVALVIIVINAFFKIIL